MLPMQEDPPPSQPTVNGIGISEFFSGLWDNLTADGRQTGISLVVGALAFYLMAIKGKLNKVLGVLCAFGAFWGAWLLWNTFTGSNRPLFPGGFQADSLWEALFRDGNEGAFFVACVVAVAAIIWIMKLGVSALLKVGIIISLILGVSFIFNFVDGFRVPSGG